MYPAPSISFRQVVAALSGCLCCVLGALSTATAADDLTAPESLAGYRFVNAFVVTDQQNPLFGMHEFYINTAGLEAFRRGGPYPEGTEFVGMVYALDEGDGTLNEGEGQAIALMRKVADARDTGGWRFAMIGADGKAMDIDPAKDCFECHTQVEDRDYVFSRPRNVGELASVSATAGPDAGE
ncbi:cytochrome P460 family protein [uncultured Thiohalocapsa sp.]|uniref:cytochrome P460 family protein n=1 Tax=uncultured Thiohalocapsa sp. TaxID=768990 RepID=UPI0025FFD970|nr:cytochrome P460 family protein [uncultured Thiohalocapsa sp.]